MKKILPLVLTVLAFHLSAQPVLQWQVTAQADLSDIPGHIRPLADGGAVLCGRKYVGLMEVEDGSVAQDDAYLVQYAADGTVLWQWFSGYPYQDGFIDVVQTSDGGYTAIGYYDVAYTVNSIIKYQKEAWLVRFNAQGAVIWEKLYDNPVLLDLGIGLDQTDDGGYILAIYNDDFTVIKTDALGNLQWQQTYGGTAIDNAACIKQIPSGGYLIAGSTNSIDGDVPQNHGGIDGWVIKIDDSGNLVWSKVFGGNEAEYLNEIALAPDGNFLIGGESSSTNGPFSSAHGASEAWLLKLNANGDLVWQRIYGGSSYEGFTGIALTPEGNCIAAGFATSNDGDVSLNHSPGPSSGQTDDFWIMETDESGNLLWEKTFGGSGRDYGSTMALAADGGYLMSGYSTSADGDLSESPTGRKRWTIKLNDVLASKKFMQQQIVYPNPAQSLLHLQLPNGNQFESLTITDLSGKIILKQENGFSPVNIENLSAGMYFLSLNSGGLFQTKFLKQ